MAKKAKRTPSFVGTLKRMKAQSTRLDQLIRDANFGDGPTDAESSLLEIRNLLRAGVRGA
jgi:hypothetical protein